jgi:hypothetical protein
MRQREMMNRPSRRLQEFLCGNRWCSDAQLQNILNAIYRWGNGSMSQANQLKELLLCVFWVHLFVLGRKVLLSTKFVWWMKKAQKPETYQFSLIGSVPIRGERGGTTRMNRFAVRSLFETRSRQGLQRQRTAYGFAMRPTRGDTIRRESQASVTWG